MQELCGPISGSGVARVWLLMLCCLALPGPHVAELDPTTPPGLQATLAAQKSLFSSLHDLTKMEGATRTVHKVIKHYYVALPTLIAPSFNLPPLLSFIASTPSESDPLLEDLKQIVDKIDAIFAELNSLRNNWVNDFRNKYGELCSQHDTNIRESWKFLRDFLVRGPKAKTMEAKSRLAEKFSTFFARTQTENSVDKLHQYMVEKVIGYDTLLKKFSDDMKKDFYELGRFSSYLTGLLMLGQQMKVYCHLLADNNGAASAEEAMKSLSNMFYAIQEELANPIEYFMQAAQDDVYKKANGFLAAFDPDRTASNVAKLLNEKYNWLRWTAVAVESRSEPEEAFDIKYKITNELWLCIKHASLTDPVTTTLSCSSDECHAPSGRCKELQAVGIHFCKCAKTFYGPNCSRNIQQDIEESRLMSWDNPIIVPDLASIYYSIMELKNLLKKSQ